MNPLQQLERQSRLWHIQKAATLILEIAANRSYEECADDVLVSSAIERQFIIIGEALSRALEVDPELFAQISDAPSIVGLRNQLVHNYPRIDSERLWEIIHTDLPKLLSEVRALLGPPPP